MAVKQNVFYVPWADVSEWNTVRDQILSPDINDTIRAYETILIWKLKFDSVPAYVECTYSLLQVMVKEYKMIKSGNPNHFDEHDLQLSYSTALIRFVNHALSVSSYKGETLFLAARSQNIPDWVINLRHDVAHGQDLPMLNVLHDAAETSLKWLLDAYWSSYDGFLESELNNPDLKLPVSSRECIQARDFLKKVFEIWDLCNEVSDASDISVDVFFLLDEVLNFSDLDLSSKHFEYLQDIVQNFYKSQKRKKKSYDFTLNVDEFKTSFLDFLKRITKRNRSVMDSVLASLIESSFVSVKNFNPKKWAPILKWIEKIELLPVLLEMLLEMAGRQHKGAVKWLTVLTPSLKVIRKRSAKLKLLKKEKKSHDVAKLKKLALKSCKSSKSHYFKTFQSPGLNLSSLSGVLMNPENLDPKVIVEYLKLVKPPLPNSTIKLMVNLVNVYTSGSAAKSDSSMDTDREIFTLFSFQHGGGGDTCKETNTNADGWVKSSIDPEAWNRCPLGLLPFQTKVDCSLPEGLIWTRKAPTQTPPVLLEKHTAKMKMVEAFQANGSLNGFDENM